MHAASPYRVGRIARVRGRIPHQQSSLLPSFLSPPIGHDGIVSGDGERCAHSHTIPSAKEGVWEPHLRRWLPHIGGVGRVPRAAFASWFS